MIKNYGRKYNFSSGPSQIPLEVLGKIKDELFNYQESGMSIMEMSHRSKYFYGVQNNAIKLLRELYKIPNNYEILFLQGGARLQFSMIPLNYFHIGRIAYINTGPWALDAFSEAKKVDEKLCYIANESKEEIPIITEKSLIEDTKFLHITSNNTINGTQYQDYPKIKNVTLIADMTSDILSKKINFEDFGIIYASAQKNLGISGVTVVIINRSLLDKANSDLPASLSYISHFNEDCMLATSPTFSIYVLNLILEYLNNNGQIEQLEKNNIVKAEMLYGIIDNSNGFYRGYAKKSSRSRMNITFTLHSEELNKLFIRLAEEEDIINIGGHHKRGGIRLSIYNWISIEDCEKISDYMIRFMESHK